MFCNWYSINTITLIHCKVNCQTLDKLSQGSTFGLKLNMCALGNLFFDEKLSKLYSRLKALNISSDAFGNRGLRIMLSNCFPYMRCIIFSNTNLTSDCVKTLAKKYPPFYRRLGFTNQKHFQYDQLLKECRFMMIQSYPLSIEGDFHQKYKKFIYLNNLMKLKDDNNHKIVFESQGQVRQMRYIAQDTLISVKNYSIIQFFFN